MRQAKFLIVEDDPLVAASLVRMLRRRGECTVAAGVVQSREQIEHNEWTAVLIDLRLPDGSGMDVLATLRKVQPRVPAIIVTGTEPEPRLLNQAAALDARFLCKPYDAGDLTPFIASALARAEDSRDVRALLEGAAKRWSLSARETDVLAAAFEGRTGARYARQEGISVNTYKSHVRFLLRKTGYDGIAALMRDLLRYGA